MNKTIKIVIMLFLTLILNTVVNADSSKNNTQESSKNEVEKIDYTLATFTPKFIKKLSYSQIKDYVDFLDSKGKNISDIELDVIDLLQNEQLIRAEDTTKRAKEATKREKEETKSYERVQRVLDAIAPTSKQKE